MTGEGDEVIPAFRGAERWSGKRGSRPQGRREKRKAADGAGEIHD